MISRRHGMKAKYNHGRFGGDLIKALHTWALEDQDCDLKNENHA